MPGEHHETTKVRRQSQLCGDCNARFVISSFRAFVIRPLVSDYFPGAQRMRLKDKVGIVVGAGQTPGETIGNGRAAAILFARAGAKVLLVDRDLAAAQETAAMIAKEGGTAQCYAGDWTRAVDCTG